MSNLLFRIVNILYNSTPVLISLYVFILYVFCFLVCKQSVYLYYWDCLFSVITYRDCFRCYLLWPLVHNSFLHSDVRQ